MLLAAFQFGKTRSRRPRLSELTILRVRIVDCYGYSTTMEDLKGYEQWIPGWVRYCAYLGVQVDSEEVQAFEFIEWIRERWAEWKTLNGIPLRKPVSDHRPFDAWLASRYPLPSFMLRSASAPGS